MARRRRSFRREAPDRGWLVGTTESQITVVQPGQVNTTAVLFDFLDIDSDPISIAKDKSDWYIKRVLIDTYASYGPASGGTQPTDTARLWQVAYGTMEVTEANALQALDPIVYDPATYDFFARLCRAYTRPVYATWAPVVDSVTGDLLTDNTPQTRNFSVADSPWGPACINDDFEVSNAGLTERRAFYAVVSASPGPGSFDWDTGDILYVRHYYRVLLQKRRG